MPRRAVSALAFVAALLLGTCSGHFVPHPRGVYRLKTAFLGDSMCLEGNEFSPASTLRGAAFMDRCQRVTGQLWSFKRTDDGYYRLQTAFQGPHKCLEGNKFSPHSTLRGAAFMDTCQHVTGQLWKIQPAHGDFFTLTTKFREGDGECLEGNKVGPHSTLHGSAFMSHCLPYSGQLFKAEYVHTN